MAKRTGIPTLIHIAHEMCRLLTKFTPVITALYPANTALLAALAAANTACAALETQLNGVRDLGD